IEVFVPRRWLVGLFARRTAFGQGALAGLAATPSMMCTCCTAPVAIGLRRRGVPLGATVAYWLANPLLNPAVLAFIALTLPWQFVATRLVVGVLVVLGAAMLANKLMTRGQPTAFATDSDEIDTPRIGNVLGRFGLTLAKYLAILVPEYALLVLLTGWFSGWLSNFAGLDRAAGPIALLAVGAVGAALVIPTGGEIPVIIGLLAAGASLGVVGTLLITLPALSLPSMVMVARTMTWQVIAAIATLVIAGGLLAVGVLTAIA
ncbi:permease, partial [Mycolicibacterium sp. CBMA 361]